MPPVQFSNCRDLYAFCRALCRCRLLQKGQFARFLNMADELRKWVSPGNVALLCNRGCTALLGKCTWIWCGSAPGILGRTPDAARLGLKKVGILAGRVSAIKVLPRGGVGYGKSARLKRPLKIGILQMGVQAGLFAGRQEAAGPMRHFVRGGPGHRKTSQAICRQFWGRKRACWEE